MSTLNSNEPAALAAVLPTGKRTYYPAIPRGTFASVRAALASIGCFGAAADLQLANAKAEGSPTVAVPLKVTLPGVAGECVGLVRRKPGGRAEFLIGLVYLETDDYSEVESMAQTLADAGKGSHIEQVFIFECTRQPGAMQ